MDTKRICTVCGKPLTPGAPEGLCPECLLKAGLGTGVDIGADTGKAPRFVPPKIEELAAKFPQLEILEFIGQGGMGAVYKARQKQLDRTVALKILPPQAAGGAGFAERFTREARALAQLNHPHIVTLYEFGQADGLFYFLMEFVDGVNLRQLLNASHMASREALAIVPQICEALQFAHDTGIVHRDIKPENILLDKKGQVKIADFGVAKLVTQGMKETAAEKTQPSGDLTEAGSSLGTPQYMAPEQIKNSAEVDHRADIYSLGVVFYQMLTGELPSGKIEPPSRKVVIDVRLDEVVLRALEKKTELRYQQASDVKTIVETIATTPEPSSQTIPPGWKHYKNDQWHFELDLPAGWNPFPPVYSNSPYEIIRFMSHENGKHMLILFRRPHNPGQSLKEHADTVQQHLAKTGFGNFVSVETIVGSKPAQILDFDRPMDNGTWSCRYYIFSEGTLGYTVGFATTDKATMFELFDRMAKSFQFQPSAWPEHLEREKVPLYLAPKTQTATAGEPQSSFEEGTDVTQPPYFTSRVVSTGPDLSKERLKTVIWGFVLAAACVFMGANVSPALYGWTIAIWGVVLFLVSTFLVLRLQLRFVFKPGAKGISFEATESLKKTAAAAMVTSINGIGTAAAGIWCAVNSRPRLSMPWFVVIVLACCGAIVYCLRCLLKWANTLSASTGDDSFPAETSQTSSPQAQIPDRWFAFIKIPFVTLRNGKPVTSWPVVLAIGLAFEFLILWALILGAAIGVPNVLDTRPIVLMVIPIMTLIPLWLYYEIRAGHSALAQGQPPVPLLSRRKKLAHRVVGFLLAVLFVLFYLRTFVVAPYRLGNDGAAPEIPRGSHFLVWKLTHNFSPGDLVVYRAGNDAFIGRVVRVDNDDLVVNKNGWPDRTVKRTLVIGKVISIYWRGTEAAAPTNMESQARALNSPPYVAHFPEGSVEMVAVASHPATNRFCWLPNGTPSTQPFPTGFSQMDNWTFQTGMRKLAFHILNEGPDALSLPVCQVDNRSGVQFGGSEWDDSENPDTYFAVALVCPANATTANISLGLAYGPWETALSLQHYANQSNGSDQQGDWRATFSAVTGSSGDVAVSCIYPARTNWVTRMVYVNDDGKVTPIREDPSHASIDPQTGATLMASSNEFAHIKEFQVQRRKYQWVEFDNISLRLGYLTAVKAKDIVGTEPAEQNANGAIRQRFEPVPGMADKTSWGVVNHSEFNPDGWAVLANMTLGGVARITPGMLNGKIEAPAAQSRANDACRIRLVDGDDDKVTLEVDDLKWNKMITVILNRDQWADLTVNGINYKIGYCSVWVAPDKPDASPFANITVTHSEINPYLGISSQSVQDGGPSQSTNATMEPTDLRQAKAQLAELRQKYGELNPNVQAALARIKELERLTEEEPNDPPDLREAKAHLAELRVSYGEYNPEVQEALERVKELERLTKEEPNDPPDLREAKAHLAELRVDYGENNPAIQQALARIKELEQGDTNFSR